MSDYICVNCGKNFGNIKQRYTQHINRKFPCVKVIIEMNNQTDLKNNENLPKIIKKYNGLNVNMNIETNECLNCNKQFSTKSSLIRHVNGRCKHSDETKFINKFNKLEKTCQLLVENNKNLQKRVDELMNDKQHKTQNNNINNTVTNTINGNVTNINVQIVDHGKEKYSKLDDQVFQNPLMKGLGKQIILGVIKNIHINPDIPENKNIVVTDINRQVCKVFNDKKWSRVDISTVNEMIDRIVEYLYVKIEEYQDKYKNDERIKDRIKTIKKYLNKCNTEYIENLKDEETENKEEIKMCNDFYNMVCKDVINLLYNYKDEILKH